ncbi:Nup53p [Fusarium albosuccineum]|uniref:Nup53p n=1 Tax=Fusarium albosuccineum TaxID=1237068 RepID=A0A8H4PHM0_9HYPO|nr:Nup53p [Fusarium albosuccineum]
MAPLILHNVPDDECYIGDDGIKRPYAMYFNQQDGPQGSTRSRRSAAESGSFGKSTRRSRSRTGTPARSRENPTLAAADKLFGDWVSNQTAPAPAVQRKSSGLMQEEAAAQRPVTTTPVELILRGYRSYTQQYAAISHYESLAGTILEDYPREPPATQRRYKSELRDPAFTRRRTLTADERALVNRADGGEHWVKVTFESREAGEAAMFASPQRILGHLVYAEPYRGVQPAKDEACPDVDNVVPDHTRSQSVPAGITPGRKNSGMPTSFNSRLLDLSPPHSQTSSLTMDTGTISNSHASTATVTEPVPLPQATTSGIEPLEIRDEDSIFCRRIPTARRATILPAEQALLPQQTVMQRFVNAIPFVKWFGGSMIGNEVPRTETGEFDWTRASLYWKLIWWLDATFGLFSGDVLNADKDD